MEGGGLTAAAGVAGPREGLPAIDWAAAWYGPWRDLGELAARQVAAGVAVHAALEALAASQASPLARPGWVPPAGDALPAPCVPRFVPQSALPGGEAYEAFIFARGECPTRENAHDFFNGLCWLRFPAAKRRLNALQAAEITAHGVGDRRGPVRDAITVFDENGALLDAPEPLWQALLARQWHRAFVELRPLWAQARLWVFGHALLEKLAAPRKDMTAHVWRANAPLADARTADAWLAQALSAPALAAKPFTPLPVLGVPGWWAANADPAFYDDARVFRPARASAAPR